MLMKYRIIPLVFILFLFGFSLITVTQVHAADTGRINQFLECDAIKTKNNNKAKYRKIACMRELAEEYVGKAANLEWHDNMYE
jgi:hypothetical protein